MDSNRLSALAAKYGTPLYVFDADEFAARMKMVKKAFGDKVRLCYSMKANPFLLACLPSEIELLEVCSPGELTVCENSGVDLTKILVSGVNKTQENVDRAIADHVEALTCESKLHIERIEKAASAANITADVYLRLTSDNQFGLDEEELIELAKRHADYPHCNIVGIHYFSGTLKNRPKLIGRELEKLSSLAERLKTECGVTISRMEYGTGLWIDYFGQTPQESEQALLDEVAVLIRDFGEKFELTVENGRFYSASCGTYLSTVMDKKTNCGFNYAIIDGGIHQMNYDGQMRAMQVPPMLNLSERTGDKSTWCICGSLCTPNDVQVRAVEIEEPELGDVFAFGRTGGYSINEGIAFLLSRDLPAVVIATKNDEKLVRDHIRLDPFNTPKI